MAKGIEGKERNRESGQKFLQATAGAGSPAVLTIPAEADEIHILDLLSFSYDGAVATAGTITITIDGNTVYDQDVTSGGVGPLDLGMTTTGIKNQEVVITLSFVTSRIPKLSLRFF